MNTRKIANKTIGGQFIGLTKTKAQNLAKKLGYKYRTVREDEKKYVVTTDFRMDRLNFEFENKKIVAADLG